jgi:hypothetical protein
MELVTELAERVGEWLSHRRERKTGKKKRALG